MKSKTKILLNYFFLVLVFLLFNINANAQNLNNSSESKVVKVKTNEWKLLASNDLVEVFYKYADCELPSEGINNEYIYLKFKNKSSESLKAEWNTEYWYKEKCIGCEVGNIENHKILLLQPNEILMGSCAKDDNKSLRLLSKTLDLDNNSILSNFNLRDLKVTLITNNLNK